MKRVDFFVSEREIERLCKAIRQAGAPGYSVMRHVTGWGVAGEISEAMDFSGLGANAHVVVFCDADALAALQGAVRPLLAHFGGVGFISEAETF
ncbi:MAG: transcriptional regulator [Cyanobacteriota bacterium]|nr:transcriptional regulator [Cyanobacteriota bacterium]